MNTMRIQQGQVWTRKVQEYEVDDIYFPANGWKVEVTRFDGKTVWERVVEYNGVSWSNTSNAEESKHSVGQFLELYILKP